MVQNYQNIEYKFTFIFQHFSLLINQLLKCFLHSFHPALLVQILALIPNTESGDIYFPGKLV